MALSTSDRPIREEGSRGHLASGGRFCAQRVSGRPGPAPVEVGHDVGRLGLVVGVAVRGLQPEPEVGRVGQRQERAPPPPARRGQHQHLADRGDPQRRVGEHGDRGPQPTEHAASRLLLLELPPGAARRARLLGQAEHHLADDVALHLRRAGVDRAGPGVEEACRPTTRCRWARRRRRSGTRSTASARSASWRRRRGCRPPAR